MIERIGARSTFRVSPQSSIDNQKCRSVVEATARRAVARSLFSFLLSNFNFLLFKIGEDRVDVHDESRNEACMFGAAPPGSAAHRSEQAAQERSGSQFESALWKNTALR